MSKFRTRTITGIVFAGLVIGCIYGGLVSAIIFFGLVLLLGSFELARMLRRNVQDYRMILSFVFAIAPYIASFYLPISENQYFILTIITVTYMSIGLISMLAKVKPDYLERVSVFSALLYLGIPFMVFRMVFLNEPYSWKILLSIILLIWSSDTFAYLIGSRIGKNKLIPRLSPGKTWEGFIGAGLCNLIVGYILYNIWGNYSIGFYLSLSVLVWFIGSFGDLFESYMKRHFGLKDSGAFLPGHGGILDRFDSFIFVIPFSALLILLFNN